MKRKLQVMAILCVSALLAGSLAGCKSGGTASSAKDQKVKLTLLDTWVPSDPGNKAFRMAYNQFLKDNPNITVDEDSIQNASMETKVQTLAAGNQLPDVFMVKGQDASKYVANGRLKDLDYMLDADSNWKSSFISGVFSNFTFNNKIYAMPFEVTNTSVYYNTSIFAKCGITSFPTDWATFESDIKTIKAKGYTPIALGDKDLWNAESDIFSTLANRYTGDDWFQNIRNHKGDAKFTDPQFVNALTAFSNLAKDGAFNTDATSLEDTQQLSLYYNQKAAMTIDGTWALSDFSQNCPAGVISETGIAALPPVPGGKGSTMTITGGAGWGYGVNSQLSADKTDAVTKLMEAIAGQGFAKDAIETNGNFPAITVTDYDKSQLTPLTKKFDDFSKNYKYIPVYDHQLPTALVTILQNGLQGLLVNSTTPSQVASQLQTEYASES